MRLFIVIFGLICIGPGYAEGDNTGEEWRSLFNGKDLTGWTPKIRTLPVGEDPLNTFRVEDGYLTVSYSNYDNFDNKFGHIFFAEPFSHYRLRLQYRFLDEQAPGGQAWAYKNSGVMVHSQAPETMPPEQDFPISIDSVIDGVTTKRPADAGGDPDAKRLKLELPESSRTTPGNSALPLKAAPSLVSTGPPFITED